MEVVTDILDVVGEIVTSFVGIMVDMFSDSGIVAVFWDSTDGITFVGTLALLGFGLGLVMFGFRWVTRLIKIRG